jgi:hypothetical protein
MCSQATSAKTDKYSVVGLYEFPVFFHFLFSLLFNESDSTLTASYRWGKSHDDADGQTLLSCVSAPLAVFTGAEGDADFQKAISRTAPVAAMTTSAATNTSEAAMPARSFGGWSDMALRTAIDLNDS